MYTYFRTATISLKDEMKSCSHTDECKLLHYKSNMFGI